MEFRGLTFLMVFYSSARRTTADIRTIFLMFKKKKKKAAPLQSPDIASDCFCHLIWHLKVNTLAHNCWLRLKLQIPNHLVLTLAASFIICSIGPLWINDNKAMGNYNRKLVCEITSSWEGKERKLVVFSSKKKAWVSNKYFVRAWEVLFLWFLFIYLKGSKVQGTQVLVYVQQLFLSTDTSVLWTPLLRLHPLEMPFSVC